MKYELLYNIQKSDKKLLYNIQRLRRSNANDKLKKEEKEKFIVSKYQEYVQLCHDFVLRVKKTIEGLRENHELPSKQELRIYTIEKFIKN